MIGLSLIEEKHPIIYFTEDQPEKTCA